MALTEDQQAARAAAMARGAEPKAEPRVLESNITPELCAAMATFQASLPEIEKDRRVDVTTKEGKDDYGYDYATLNHVNYTLIPKLAALGLAFISLPTLGMDGRTALRYYLTHSGGGFIAAEYPLRGDKYQQIGSAITYMRRYAIQAVTGVAAPEEDDDGQAADADSGPRTAARRARTDQAAANTAARRETGTARRRQPPAAEPVADDSEPEDPDRFRPRNPDGPSSGPQHQRLAILFGDMAKVTPAGKGYPDLNDRAVRLGITSQLVGRRLGSSKDLTAGEAHQIMNLMGEALKSVDPVGFLKDATERAETGRNTTEGQP